MKVVVSLENSSRARLSGGIKYTCLKQFTIVAALMLRQAVVIQLIASRMLIDLHRAVNLA